MTRTARQLLGAAGEGHARRYLEARDYSLVARNWRGAKGELDLVMIDGGELVFVEVKTRRGDTWGRAEEAVTSHQGRTLLATAEEFLLSMPEYQEMIWRIDIIAITLDRAGGVEGVAHYENAVGAW
jgi:putative endonuclease